MRIVKDVSELPKLFEMPIEWGIVITDNQIIVYAQEEGEKWQGHYSGADFLLRQAFPKASKTEIDGLFNNRIILIGCAPKEVLTVYMPTEHNLSNPQSDSLIEYIKDIKQSGAMKDRKTLFWDRKIINADFTVEILLETLQLKEPQFTDIDYSEVIIGIPIKEYLQSAIQSKPRT